MRNLGEIASNTPVLASDVSGSDTAFFFRQALINGNMDVWQAGTTFTFNDDTYGPDMWNLLTETNGAWTCARDTDVPAGVSKYSAKFSNVTLNNQCALVNFIENADAIKLNGKTVNLSFYAKTSGTEIGNLRAAILSWSSTADVITSDVIGTWAQDGNNPTWATNWTMENTPSNLALTASWTRYDLSATIDTANMTNVAIVIWVDDGTIAANDDFWITGVQVNEGSTALSFQPSRFDEELKKCLRYYEQSFPYGVAPVQAYDEGNTIAYPTQASGTGALVATGIRFQIKKRISTYTLTLYRSSVGTTNGRWQYLAGGVGWSDLDASPTLYKSEDGFNGDFAKAGAFVNNNTYCVKGLYTADARL